MTYLPIRSQGAAWLTNNEAEVRFVKPAYDRDVLTIEHEADSGETICRNAAKMMLATMQSRPFDGPPNPAHEIEPSTEPVVREEIAWENLYTDKPAPAHVWRADFETNLALAEQINDDLDLWRGDNALVHPFWTLRHCNAAFSRSFILPAWMHVGSKIRFHKPLEVGQEIETRMVPIEKWERKGHQFTTLYIPFLVDGEVCVEVEHTSIFRIAPPPAEADRS